VNNFILKISRDRKYCYIVEREGVNEDSVSPLARESLRVLIKNLILQLINVDFHI